MGIVNVVGSTIARTVKGGIYTRSGPEIGVASTKSFTSQVTALYLLMLHLKQERRDDIIKEMTELKKIPEKIGRIMKKEKQIKRIAEKYSDKNNFLYLGRGISFPVALEGALKLKEISYIHAEGYPAAEMKHGPIALIDEEMPVVFLAEKNTNYGKVISNMQEVKARKGKIIAITTENNQDKTLKELSDDIITIPKTTEELTPLLNVIPLQFLAYHLAVKRGLDPDKPRNLAKSVTVE
jgi:glucosamine--fructose-6-phosphate aminotransferase (isomerizing)